MMPLAGAIIMLSLILNGKPVDLPHPVFGTTGGEGFDEAQIMVPVRDAFEAMGFVVQWHGDDPSVVSITGYVDRLPRRHLLRTATLHVGEPRVECAEYQADLPVPPEKLDGCLYAPLIALRIITGADLRVDFAQAQLRCDLFDPEDAPSLTIAELVSDLPTWLHRRVTIRGEFIGPGGDPAWPSTSMGAPAPAAWAVRDDTGAIYCTDVIVAGGQFAVPVDFSPGERIEVAGIVRPGWGGILYLSVAESRSVQSDN